MRKRKGITPLISAVIYIGIMTAIITMIVTLITPALQKMEDKAAFSQAKNIMTGLDSVIKEVASEGQGSMRVFPLQIKKGELIIDGKDNKITYLLETKALIVAPNTIRKIGDLEFGSNMDVDVIDNGNTITMKNSYLEINISKIGNQTNYSYINLSNVIQSIYLIKEHKLFNGSISFKVDNISSGYGYVYAEQYGYNLPKGVVIIHLNTTAEEFDLVITLDSYSDFIKVNGENFVVH